jgi:phenylalanyl-tRNA synthetase beta chain
MKIPISWLKEMVDIRLPIEQLAARLTLAGLEVEGIRYVGLPLPSERVEGHGTARQESATNITGLAWDREKLVVGQILEVMPHPNADRLVLCRLHDGEREHSVLTGAPNLFPFKGQGSLERPLKVAYAKEGAVLYDGHQPGWVLMTLRRAKIRGVESYSMACSEKELGISEDHEGIILLDDDAVPGTPLADYMGDAVLDIALTPNLARCASVLGVAREVAALTGAELREPSYEVGWSGPGIEGRVLLEIRQPELNPRFVLGLIEGVRIAPSPYRVQRRLRLAGMRPINNVVDATNYAMLEIGQPLHAFDYEILRRRSGGQAPTLITRLPEPGERLTTLDGVERPLDDFTILVADTRGALSLGGVMGGAESEVSQLTTTVLLEGAAWYFLNIRRTVAAQKLPSEAAYRFERGVHPAMAERGVRRGLELMRLWSGGMVAEGLVDQYPRPAAEVQLEIGPEDARRWLGISLEAEAMAEMLGRLGFAARLGKGRVLATVPDHRLDIGEGTVGAADLMEEVARLYGYDRIPETQISDTIPPQHGNPQLDREERLKDLLAGLGLQEVVTYRLTSPEQEARLWPGSAPVPEYVRLANPLSADKSVLRRELLGTMLSAVERSARARPRIALFELGQVFHPRAGKRLPEERLRLAVVLRGPRADPSWRQPGAPPMDFYDLKGILEQLAVGLHLGRFEFNPSEHPGFHPGKCAVLRLGGERLGLLGELHPQVAARFGLNDLPLAAAEVEAGPLLAAVPDRYAVEPVPAVPPVLEDLALIVGQEISAEQVRRAILAAGAPLVREVRLFDVYQGPQVGEGKVSLAYSLTYQAPDRTLTDAEVAALRQRIVAALERDLGAKLREA